MYTDITLGVGGVINSAFVAPLGTLDVAARFKLGRAVTLGPQVSLVALGEPSWQGDADVMFSSTSGAQVGVGLTAGGRRVAFGAELGYLFLSPMDVETGGAWRASDSKLDVSDVMLRLGVPLFL